MRSLTSAILFVMLLFVFSKMQAQKPTVRLTPDKTQIMIGDALNINIEVICNPDIQIVWPFKADSLGKFEITEMALPDTTTMENGQLKITQKLTVTAFEADTMVIPTQTFSYRNKQSGSGGVLRTDMQTILVTEPEINPESDIKDIAPILELPKSFWEKILPYLLAILGIGLILLLWFWYQKSKKKPRFEEKPLPPPPPPHVVALKRLQELDKAKYWQQGQEKQYYSELTDVLREYIENRYQIQALELTTDETIRALKKISIEKNALFQLNQLMQLADLVKFAKAHPTVDQHLQALSEAETFVRKTKPVEELTETQAPTL